MRVLCVTNMHPGPSDPDYGAFVESMCGALTKLGHEVEVAAIDSRASGAIATPRKYLGLLTDTARRARRADVLYAHYLMPTGVIAAACGRLAGRPVVLTAHGGDVAHGARHVPRQMIRWAVAHSDKTIAVSRALRSELEALLDAPPAIDVINMGVDLERFDIRDRTDARHRLGVGSDPLVLSVGGLTDRKNPVTLIQAFRQLRERVPNAQLVFVGDGPLRQTLVVARKHLGLADAVTMTGAVPHEAVADWMTACDVLALVSKREPLGQVALEALASGRPVVATAIGGTPEIVPADGPGRVVDPSDSRAIASALGDLLLSPPSPLSCREAARPNSLAHQAAAVALVLQGALDNRGDGEGASATAPADSG